MNSRIHLNSSLSYYLQNCQSNEARAFFNGARAMMEVLQLAPPSEYPSILSASNQQHIIALLAKREEQQRERRRGDASKMLEIYQFNPLELYAFIFNLAKVNANGQAIDDDGAVIENEMFCPLPGKTQKVWPDYKIEHVNSDQRITYAHYMSLDERTRDDYIYSRNFRLRLNGQPAFRIGSEDRVMMEELIRRCILSSNGEANRRFLSEIYSSADECKCGLLYTYRDTVLNTFEELEYLKHNSPAAPIMAASCGEPHKFVEHGVKIESALHAQIRKGYIASPGQLLIAQFYQLYLAAKSSDLLNAGAYSIDRWTRVIRACHCGDVEALNSLITVEDIHDFRNVNGSPMNKAIYDRENDEWKLVDSEEYEFTPDITKEHFFMHVLVPKVAKRLMALLDHVSFRETLDVIGVDADTTRALDALNECLAEIFSNNTPTMTTNPSNEGDQKS